MWQSYKIYEGYFFAPHGIFIKQQYTRKNKKPSCWREIADHTYRYTVSNGSLLLMSFCCDAWLLYDHYAGYIRGLKVVKSCSCGHFLFSWSDIFTVGCIIYHSDRRTDVWTDKQMDRQTDRQHDHANSQSYLDRLKPKNVNRCRHIMCSWFKEA